MVEEREETRVVRKKESVWHDGAWKGETGMNEMKSELYPRKIQFAVTLTCPSRMPSSRPIPSNATTLCEKWVWSSLFRLPLFLVYHSLPLALCLSHSLLLPVLPSPLVVYEHYNLDSFIPLSISCRALWRTCIRIHSHGLRLVSARGRQQFLTKKPESPSPPSPSLPPIPCAPARVRLTATVIGARHRDGG